MSSTYGITALAQTDLDEIWLYVARDRPFAADQLMERFQSAFTHLAAYPLLGESRPEIAAIIGLAKGNRRWKSSAFSTLLAISARRAWPSNARVLFGA